MRYLMAGASGYSKLVNAVSLVGLSLGIMLMIVVSSVHNGLADERRERLLQFVPHAFLEIEEDMDAQFERIGAISDVVAVRQEFQGMAFMRRGSAQPLTLNLIGVDTAMKLNLELDFLDGELKQLGTDNAMVLSMALATRYGLAIDDEIDLTFVSSFSNGLKTQSGTFKVTGVFRSQTEVDALAAFVSLRVIKDSTLVETGKLGWNISVADPFAVEDLKIVEPKVVTWIDEYGEAFRAYQTERIAMYVLMTLVLMLASFNIIAGQAMLINVKRRDIAILTTIGASRRQLLTAFAIQGGSITVLGIALGVVLGLTISHYMHAIFDAVDDVLGISILEQTAFDELPARVAIYDVLGAILIALVLGIFALVKPLRLALLESPVYVLNRSG